MDIKQLHELSSNFNVLYVEDDESIAEIFTAYLKKLFKEVVYCTNGQEALEAFSKAEFDLIITDIQMPIMSGLEMIEKIKEQNSEQTILIISAYSDPEKFITSIKSGVDGYLLKPIDFNSLNDTLYKVVKKIKTFQEHKLYETRLQELVESKTHENLALQLDKINNYEQTLHALVDIIESRDTYTGKHSLRVAQYCELIAKELGFEQKACDELYKAAILHDIGKVAIPDSLLLKPSRLTDSEFSLIQQHVNIGFHMLSQIPMYEKIAQTINQHHERRDGSGYPQGLKGDDVCIEATIMGVADSFDAMTTNRIYKHRKSIPAALEEIEKLKDSHFTAQVVDAALKVLKTIKIDYTLNQVPSSNLEHERFSYFYKDNLTGLYNEQYLDFMLANSLEQKELTHLNLLLLDNFGEYNKTHGWSQGNKLLINIANHLKSLLNDLFIFRIHGDDFILLSAENVLDTQKLTQELQPLLEGTNITSEVRVYDIFESKIDSIEKLEAFI